MFELSPVIEEVISLDFEKVKEYINNKDNMIHFLDVIVEDENGNETVTEESYFSINQQYHRTFEDDPSDVIDFILIMDDICSVCFDEHRRKRPTIGIVDSYDDTLDSNLNFVPKFKYDISRNSDLSHQYYFIIELPNPAIDYTKYTEFRSFILGYIQEELESFGYH